MFSRELATGRQIFRPAIMAGPGRFRKWMNAAAELIRDEARRQGVMSFRRFMEIALYEPGLGYYERARIGRGGDFQTSVSVGPLFGELLAWQFGEWLDRLRRAEDAPLVVVESGAHDGRLAADILRAFDQWRPELAPRLTYVCLEPSAIRRRWQEETLAQWRGRVRWMADWSELESPVRGVIFSNELLDAFPFHLFFWARDESRWREIGVALDGGQLVWCCMPRDTVVFDPGLPGELLEVLPDGFCTEHNPAAERWWGQAAKALEAGKLMTIDYGLDEEEFFAPHRREGTARAYLGHRLVSDLLSDPGEQDLTAQVNFTRILREGDMAGLDTETDTTQTRFLTRLLTGLRRSGRVDDAWFASRAGAFQTLTHPDHFGRGFRVVIQSRASSPFGV